MNEIGPNVIQHGALGPSKWSVSASDSFPGTFLLSAVIFASKSEVVTGTEGTAIEGATALAKELWAGLGHSYPFAQAREGIRALLGAASSEEIENSIIGLQSRLKVMENIIDHCWTNAGEAGCGVSTMSTSEQRVFREIVLGPGAGEVTP